MAIKKLLFIDTNIWLDFYRARNEAGLRLLNHVEDISDKVIVTFQLESEFKRNRQTVILESMRELKSPPQIPRLGIFSDAKATEVMSRRMKVIEGRLATLKTRLHRALESPASHDPIYKACQRIFHRDSPIVLKRTDKIRRLMMRYAFRRFLHGDPPRKRGDISIGDAFNWEWMVYCATMNKAELVIVSRDSDYGVLYGDQSYINDELRHEFSLRVSKKRKLLLYQKLSDALKHFQQPVTKQEQQAESEIVEAAAQKSGAGLLSGSIKLKDLAQVDDSPEALQRYERAYQAFMDKVNRLLEQVAAQTITSALDK